MKEQKENYLDYIKIEDKSVFEKQNIQGECKTLWVS